MENNEVVPPQLTHKEVVSLLNVLVELQETTNEKIGLWLIDEICTSLLVIKLQTLKFIENAVINNIDTGNLKINLEIIEDIIDKSKAATTDLFFPVLKFGCLGLAFQDYCKKLGSRKTVEVEFINYYALTEKRFPKQKHEILIYRLFKEVTDYLLSYSEKPAIKITASENNNDLYLEFETHTKLNTLINSDGFKITNSFTNQFALIKAKLLILDATAMGDWDNHLTVIIPLDKITNSSEDLGKQKGS